MEKKKDFLNIKKLTTFKNIPPNVLKSRAHSCSKTLFNDTKCNSEFPEELKLAEVTAIFKKDDPTK